MSNHDEQGQSEWEGFSCPACQTIFRVPEKSAGKRVECPACMGIVTIPASGRPDPSQRPVVEHLRTGGGEERVQVAPEGTTPPPIPGVQVAKGTKLRMRKKVKKPVRADLDWDRSIQEPSKPPRANLRVLVGAGAALVIMLGGISALVLRGNAESGARVSARSALPPDTGVIPGERTGTARDLIQAELEKVEMSKVVSDVEEVVREFLRAEGVDQLLEFVRGDDALKRRIREYYQSTAYAPIVPRNVAPFGRIMKSGDLWAVDVVLPDFSARPIAVEKVGETYKVDWDSWVGYSDVPWDLFQETRPVEPALFRVLCSKVDYFNFAFSKERDWRSYRLESPDRTHVLYGYVPRHSALESKLLPAKRATEAGHAFVVMLRYPEKATTGNQVLIDEVVESGWVVGSRRSRSKSE